MALAACAAPMEYTVTTGVVVDGQTLEVGVADDLAERNRGLREHDAMPEGIDGVLFAYSRPTATTFDMETVGFDLDIWWFDGNGVLLGSARMGACPDGPCVSYGTPGPIMWALETTADEFSFSGGASLRFEP